MPSPTPPTETKIRVTKLQAARQQLRTAIRVWFTSEDHISVHTLSFAAYEILHTLARRKGAKNLLFDHHLIKEEYRKDWSAILKSEANFFKHAREDPNGEIDFLLLSNEIFMLYCIRALIEMGEWLGLEENAFVRWIHVSRPEFLTEEGLQQIPSEHTEIARNISRKEFFDSVLKIWS